MENSPSSRINGSGSDGGLTDAGIAALKKGDKAQARKLLAQALKRDPNNLRAWLWLSGAVETEADRRHCLQRVLQIDPQNRAAQRGLEQLRAVAPAPPIPETTAKAEAPAPVSPAQHTPQATPAAMPAESQRETVPLEPSSLPDPAARVEAVQAPQAVTANPKQIVWPPPETQPSSEQANAVAWPPPETPVKLEHEKHIELSELLSKRDWKALLHLARKRLLQLKELRFKKPELKKPKFLQKLPPISINPKLKRLLHPLYLAYAAFGVVVMIAFGVAINQFINQMSAQEAQVEQVAAYEDSAATPTLDRFTLARTATAEARRATAAARATERAMPPTPTAVPTEQRLVSARSAPPVEEVTPQVSPVTNDDVLENLSEEIELGRSFARNQQYDEAFRVYNQILQKNPEDVTAYYYRGRLRNYLKEHDTALEDFNKAIELLPTFAQAYYGRCSAQMFMGDYEKALPDCQKAIELKPDYPDAYVDLGVIYMNMQQYGEALASFNTALSIDAEHAYAYLDRGYLYVRLGENYKAIDDFTKAMELDSSIDALCPRGSVRFYIGDYEGAIADCSEAIRRNPRDTAPYYNRARSYAAIGDYERALQDYTSIISLQDRPANAYLQRGMIYEYLGRSDQALEDYLKADQIYKATGNSYASNMVQQLIQRLKRQPEV